MRSVNELLESSTNNTNCIAASIRDALWLNDLEINSNMLFMMELTSFNHLCEFNYNNNPLIGISYVQNNADLELLDSLGIGYSNAEDFIFDEYIESGIPLIGKTCMADLNGYSNKVNFEPLHTEIFLKLENGMYLTGGMGSRDGSYYMNRPKHLVDKARHSKGVPFSPQGLAYYINTDINQGELDEAAEKRIRNVISKIKNSYNFVEEPKAEKTSCDEDMHIYSGISCLDKITDFVNRSFELYRAEQITKTNLVVNLHCIRRGIMPHFSAGDFARTEICNSLSYLAGYFKDSSFDNAANILDTSKKYWVELGKILYSPKEHLVDEKADDFKIKLLGIFDNIFDIELETVNALNSFR